MAQHHVIRPSKRPPDRLKRKLTGGVERDDLAYIEELVQATGRDTVAPETPPEQIDWR